MTTITVCQRKGGNGKSTSALNLAHAFSRAGYRVLLIDLDEQKNTSSAISTTTIPQYTIEHVLVGQDVSVQAAAVATDWDGVHLVASSSGLSGAVRELDREYGSHVVLKEKLSPGGWDFCIIDTSPSLNILVVNALVASRYAFIPLSSRYFSLQGLGQTLESVAKVSSRLNTELSVLAAAFVLHDKRSSLAREVLAKAQETYPDLICQATVGVNIKIEEAQVLRQSIFQYAPEDRGAQQYQALAEELLSRFNS
jgi:chromosome partitioning protein